MRVHLGQSPRERARPAHNRENPAKVLSEPLKAGWGLHGHRGHLEGADTRTGAIHDRDSKRRITAPLIRNYASRRGWRDIFRGPREKSVSCETIF